MRSAASLLVLLVGFVVVATGQELSETPRPDAVRFSATARLEADPRATTGHKPPLTDATLVWRAEIGSRIEVDDPLLGFDCEPARRQLMILYRGSLIAELEMARTELQKRQRLDELQERAARLAADIGVTEAKAATSAEADAAELALAEARYREAERANQRAQRELERSLAAHQRGQITPFALERDRLAADRAAAAAELAHQRWRHLREDRLREIAHQRDRIKLEGQRFELGVPASDGEPATGLFAEIEAIEARSQGQLANASHWIERRSREFDERLPEIGDVTPLRRLVIDRDGAVVHRLDLISGEGEVRITNDPSWIIPERNQSPFWAQQWEPGARTLCGPIAWSRELPAGNYLIRLEIGGSRSWRGAAITIAGELIAVRDETAAEPETIEHRIEHPGGHLRIDFNGPFDLTLRSDAAGVVDHSTWVSVGDVIRWNHHDVAFVKDPDRLRLRSRIHQDLVPFLEARKRAASSVDDGIGDEGEAARITEVRRAMAATRVSVVEGGRILGEAEIVAIGDRAVPLAFTAERRRWYQDEQRSFLELGREVTLRPIGEWTPPLLRRHLEIIVTCEAPEDVTLVPPHLVLETPRGHFVQARGTTEARQVNAFRIGNRYAVLDLDLPMRDLSPTITDPDASGAGLERFTGQVVTGASVAAIMGDTWGRVVDLIPNGSEVETGDEILSVANPWLESKQDELASANEQAQSRALTAAENRRLAAIRRRREQQSLLREAEDARLAIEAVRTIDRLAVERARTALENAEADAALAEREASAHGEMGRHPQRIRDAQRRADLARIELRRSALQAAAARRGPSLVAVIDREAILRDVLDRISLREAELRIAEIREQVDELRSALQEERANWLVRYQRQFEEHRTVTAPSSGILVYRKAYSQQSSRYDIIDQGSFVWRGLTVADIIDLKRLAFVAELPEARYDDVAAGQEVLLRFPQLTPDPLEARITEVGKVLSVPEEDQLVAEALSASRRTFIVRVALDVPAHLVGRVIPGTKGEVILP